MYIEINNSPCFSMKTNELDKNEIKGRIHEKKSCQPSLINPLGTYISMFTDGVKYMKWQQISHVKDVDARRDHLNLRSIVYIYFVAKKSKIRCT